MNTGSGGTGFIKNKKLILCMWLAVIFVFVSGFFKFLLSGAPLLDNSISIWFDNADSEIAIYDKYLQDFGEQEWNLAFVETGDIYDPGFLRELKDLSQRIEDLDDVRKVLSIATISDNLQRGEEIYYSNIWQDGTTKEEVQKSINNFKKLLHANPIFEDTFFRENNKNTTAILIQTKNEIRSKENYKGVLVDDIRKIMSGYSTITNYGLAGNIIINSELNRTGMRDLVIFASLITVVVTLFGIGMLGNIRDIAIMFAVVLTGIIVCMGSLAIAEVTFNVVTIMIPTVMVALSVASVVHIIGDFHGYRARYDADTAASLTIKELYKPSFWTMATTVVAFSSYAISAVEPIFQLGVYTSIGLVGAWLAAMYVSPVLLAMFWEKSKFTPSDKASYKIIKRITGVHVHYPKLSILVFAVMSLLLLGVPKLGVDTDYSRFYGPGHSANVDYAELAKEGFAQNSTTILLSFPEGKSYNNEEYFSAIYKFEDRLRKEDKIIKLLSLTELLKQTAKSFNGSETDISRYDTKQISQLRFLAELAGNDDVGDFVDFTDTKVQLIALTKHMSSKDIVKFKHRVKVFAEQYLPPDLEVNVTGSSVLWANMDEGVSKSQITSLVVVTLFLMVVFPILLKSVWLSVVALIFNALPLAMTFGLMGILDIKIDMATAMIGGISLGIIVDDTIHLLVRVKAFTDAGDDLSTAVDKTLDSIGVSLLKTSLILVAGFSVMAASNFLPTRNMGAFISASIVLALVYDVVFLPLFLKFLSKSPTLEGIVFGISYFGAKSK